MTAARTRAEQFGFGKLQSQWCLQCDRRVFRPCASKFCKAVPAQYLEPPAPPPLIGFGPAAPAYFPYLSHRTQQEIMDAEGRK